MKLEVSLKELIDRKFKKASGDVIEGKSLSFILLKEVEGVKLSCKITFSKDVWPKYAKEVTDSFGKPLVLEVYSNQSALDEFLTP